ncbi:MAG: DUF362 domain-containing protein [Bradymonadales bacterium]|nr:DUF362 domain-containing protein [Bradymonadales bacterium]
MPDRPAINRRDFLKYSATGAVTLTTGLGLGGSRAVGQQPFTPRSRPGHVVRIAHSQALSDPDRVDSEPVCEVVELMVNAAILAFTGRGELAVAYGELFCPEDRVLIKLSCLGSPNMATNEAVVAALIKGLKLLGIPEQNMVLYDQYRNRMMRARYRPGGDLLGVPIEFSRTRGYSGTAIRHDAGSSPFAVAFEQATAVISVPVFKDHDVSGFTGGMKNITHGCTENPSQMHRNHCAAIADIYNTDMVRSRMRLLVADVLRLMYHEGPQDNPNKEAHNSVYLATDPVALDTIGLQLVNEARTRHDIRSLEEDGRPNTYLARATELGLGEHRREAITLEEHLLA